MATDCTFKNLNQALAEGGDCPPIVAIQDVFVYENGMDEIIFRVRVACGNPRLFRSE